MGSTWKKAVVLLAVCGALGACGSSGDQADSPRPQLAHPAPAQYDALTLAQPPQRVIDF